ncbi:spermidine synthase [Thalassotalea fusca]
MKKLFLDKLNLTKQALASVVDENSTIQLWHSPPYLWVSIDGEQVQSIMNKDEPTNPVLPVPQSMLIWLLWTNCQQQVHILNLGMGTGTIERVISTCSNVNVTSVEKSKAVIKLARQHFNLSKQRNIINQCAIEFVEEHTQHQINDSNLDTHYDVIMVDLFEKESTPESLLHQEFYNLSQLLLTNNGTLVLNLYLASDAQLLSILHHVRTLFRYKLIIDFDDYQNIVLVLSHQRIPEQHALLNTQSQFTQLFSSFSHASQILSHLHYI